MGLWLGLLCPFGRVLIYIDFGALFFRTLHFWCGKFTIKEVKGFDGVFGSGL